VQSQKVSIQQLDEQLLKGRAVFRIAACCNVLHMPGHLYEPFFEFGTRVKMGVV